jgi:hypothetical protein
VPLSRIAVVWRVAYSNWLGDMSCEIYLGFEVSS